MIVAGKEQTLEAHGVISPAPERASGEIDDQKLRHDQEMAVSAINSVLFFNPTTRTSVEHAFWSAFSRNLAERGYRTVLFDYLGNPLRCEDASWEPLYTYKFWFNFHEYNNEVFARLAQEFESSAYDLLGQREGALNYLVKYAKTIAHTPAPPHEILTGVRYLMTYFDYLVAKIRPKVVVVNNDTLPVPYLVGRIARERGVQVICSERAPTVQQWFEPNGYYALSELHEIFAGKPSLDQFVSLGRETIEELVLRPTAHRSLEPRSGTMSKPAVRKPDMPLLKSTRPRRILLAMDALYSTGWKPSGHPLRTTNYPIYASPENAISKLAAIADGLGAVLVVKPHPNKFQSISESKLPPNCELYTGDLREILELVDVVVCFLSKVAFAAMAMGKAVVTLAPNPAHLSGLTFHCASEAEVRGQIRDALKYEWTGEKRRQLAGFLGYLRSEYFVDEDIANHGAKRMLDTYFPPLDGASDHEVAAAVEGLAALDHFPVEKNGA